MDQKELLKVSDRLYEYQALYPDATLSAVNLFDDSISHKDGLELSKLICHMTHSGLLQFWIFGEKMYIFRSKEFLKVADGFKKGAKVRWYDPRDPDDIIESTMLADGMRYQDGIPFIWNENSDSGCFAECNTFAVYWRPVEEGK